MGAEAFPPCFPKENATTMGAEAFPPCFPRENATAMGAEAFPPCFLFQNWLNYTIEFAISKNYN